MPKSSFKKILEWKYLDDHTTQPEVIS